VVVRVVVRVVVPAVVRAVTEAALVDEVDVGQAVPEVRAVQAAAPRDPPKRATGLLGRAGPNNACCWLAIHHRENAAKDPLARERRPMHHAASPSLIALDWGTSSLRAYLMGRDGALLERRTQPWGIQHLPEGGFVAAFRGIAGDWRDRLPTLPVLAAGMVGSRHGWREVPYVDCPADPAAIAAGIVAFDGGCGTVHIVPGLMQGGELPDVMRGEETQIVGALAIEPELAAASLFVLPGTHCKWADIRTGRVVRFTTYITGELYAVLRDHSILGRPAKEAVVQPADAALAVADASFRRGLKTAYDSGPEGMAGRLFTTRSLFLNGDLPASQTLDYLSGLLIGEEVRSVIAGFHGRPCQPIVLLGDAGLCDRYHMALAEYGITSVRAIAETGPSGLWQIASAARLLLEHAPG